MKVNHKVGQSARMSLSMLLTVGLGLMALTSSAFADDGYSMAPPVQQAAPAGASGGADSVFQWNEVPQDQQIPVVRGVFDQGGYQLYDNVGETIVVPFANNDLYVMRFAISDNGSMYFVNNGTEPTLYVPQNGYLENATVPGARWYPFTKTFHPAEPVFLGIAPSWHLFIGMGWYPHMSCWGGYWADRPFIAGAVFVPCSGFVFDVGGSFFFGWGSYHNYWWHTPPPYHMAYWHRDVYRWAARPIGPSHAFVGVRGGFGGGHFAAAGGGGRVFRGAGGAYRVHEGGFSGGHGFQGNSREGGMSGGHSFQGGGGDHGFRGADAHSSFQGGGSGHSFNGGGGHSGSHSFGGGSHGSSHGGGDHGGGDHGGGGHHDH